MEYEDLYQVSNYGNVVGISKGYSKNRRILKQHFNDGYYMVTLYDKKGVSHSVFVHRLVALAFLQNPNKFPVVNHKDGNRLNNNVSNLEWCTQKYNIWHGLLRREKKRKINIYTMSGDFVDSTETILEAAHKTHTRTSQVRMCCTKERSYSHGFVFRFADDKDGNKIENIVTEDNITKLKKRNMGII